MYFIHAHYIIKFIKFIANEFLKNYFFFAADTLINHIFFGEWGCQLNVLRTAVYATV
jgi:hypothetical protein